MIMSISLSTKSRDEKVINTNVCHAVLKLVHSYTVDDFSIIAKTGMQYETHKHNYVFDPGISPSEM